MLRMNTSNGFWPYVWSGITGFLTMLTLQDVLFALGAVVTALFTWLTYRSNNRRNQAQIEESRQRTEEERKRTEILKTAYARGDVSEIKQAAQVLDDIETVLQPQPQPQQQE